MSSYALGVCEAAIAPVTGIIVGSLCSGGCAPYRWDAQGRWIVYEYAKANPITKPWTHKGDLYKDDLQAGDVNCRYDRMLSMETEDRCGALLKNGDTTEDKFFTLNPTLQGDCSNIRYNTPYCVEGFLEPLRAYDGRCGPPHKNATCIGVDHGGCCNSESWTCGESDHDCAPGICYEGYCWGHKRYTTDGTCGSQNENRQCAGKWGNCCSVDGKCGTGPEFCAIANCYSGDCEGEEEEKEEKHESTMKE